MHGGDRQPRSGVGVDRRPCRPHPRRPRQRRVGRRRRRGVDRRRPRAAGCGCRRSSCAAPGIRTHANARLEGREIVVTSGDEAGRGSRTRPTSRRSSSPTAVAALCAASRRATAPGRFSTAWRQSSRSSALTAVVGPSGSGKTTLLHLLAGLELPDRGRRRRARHAARRSSTVPAVPDFRRDHIGYIGQQPGLVPTLSALENVELALALRGLPADARPRDARRRRARGTRRAAGVAPVDGRARPRRDRARPRAAGRSSSSQTSRPHGSTRRMRSRSARSSSGSRGSTAQPSCARRTTRS